MLEGNIFSHFTILLLLLCAEIAKAKQNFAHADLKERVISFNPVPRPTALYWIWLNLCTFHANTLRLCPIKVWGRFVLARVIIIIFIVSHRKDILFDEISCGVSLIIRILCVLKFSKWDEMVENNWDVSQLIFYSLILSTKINFTSVDCTDSGAEHVWCRHGFKTWYHSSNLK